MVARLIPIVAGAAEAIPLRRPILLVGRHPECDARIDLPQVSRRHCCLAIAYGRTSIRDLGSRHGVRVNGRAVEESQLFPGDEIAIGHLIYRFEEPAEGPAPTRPVAARPAAKPKTPSPPPESTDDDGPVDLSALEIDFDAIR